ncbi:hypothetical protein [Parachitinimonas caeni]|uniref:Uncharacterized protein n=1 Tax=Parachitinimonas caeni TaxID=3031301 RepID=A0ABT7DXT1_9NEIS|nr:hypothetical protein [Parachitinimonas caeni]MDK2124876.1 hypothetical protein [Parachitinimonas caeni]
MTISNLGPTSFSTIQSDTTALAPQAFQGDLIASHGSPSNQLQQDRLQSIGKQLQLPSPSELNTDSMLQDVQLTGSPNQNAADFSIAINDKADQLHALFESVRIHSPSSTATQVLNCLEDAFAQCSKSRSGESLTLSAAQSHSALLHGAHFVVNDHGALASELRRAGGDAMHERTSAHYQDAGKQYGMDLPGGLGHLLVGTNSEGHSFFQMESPDASSQQQPNRDKLSNLLGVSFSNSSASIPIQHGPHGVIAASEKNNTHMVLQPINS